LQLQGSHSVNSVNNESRTNEMPVSPIKNISSNNQEER